MRAQILADSALISPDLKTTSLIIAENFGKQHRDVIRRIESLEIPKDYCRRNFGETEVFRPSPLNGAPIKSKSYEMTRDGFALLVMGFTGKKAMVWKIKFLEAFNAMEAVLKNQGDTGLTIKPTAPKTKTQTENRIIHWESKLFEAKRHLELLGWQEPTSPGSNDINVISSELFALKDGLERLTHRVKGNGVLNIAGQYLSDKNHQKYPN